MKNDSLLGYHIQDSRELDKVIKNKIVDVIITSPPYWNLKDYGTDEQIGLGQKYDSYLKEVVELFDKCYDITKESGSMWVVIDTIKKNGEMIPLPFEFVSKLKDYQLNKIKTGMRDKEQKWHLQDIIIWQKNKTLPWSHKGKVRKIFEYVLFFSKSKKHFKYYIDNIRDPENLKKWAISHPERYNPRGKVPTQIWEFNLITQGWTNKWIRHACPFPIELVERILHLTTDENDVVFDPFAGSGSVLAQAHTMNRKYIGFDLNTSYKKMFYNQVLPKVVEMQSNLEKSGLTLKKKQENLMKDIIGRRKLKYAREIIRRASKNNPEIQENVGYIFVDGLKNKLMTCDIYYILKNKSVNKINFEDVLNQQQKITLLRKYTLDAKIHVTHILPHKFSDQDDFYYYPNSQFKAYKDKIKIAQHLGNQTELLPDIISNICVSN